MNDPIEREDVLKAIWDWCCNREYAYSNATYWLQKRINAIPSADRPQGEWIYNGNFCGMNHHKCSVCGRTEFRMSAYCPNCGARMKGADDDRI